jgi:diguanylate cyclase (GGDEF)-like protein
VFSVAVLDLDGFKNVNDTYGHAKGDEVLSETARRLAAHMGNDDLLARLGGDEFVILFDNTRSQDALERLTQILHAVARPYETVPLHTHLGVSIGVTEFPTDGDDYARLLKNADTAMYNAKYAGKNQVSVYVAKDNSAYLTIKASMHDGIMNGEFYMEYQPQFDMQRRLVGVEALMRWKNAILGQVPPDKFIPIAEESGLMPFLGKWAIQYASHQLHKFQEWMPQLVMSVNVSPVQFIGEDFDKVVLGVVRDAGIAPHAIILEITESTMMHRPERTERVLSTLRDAGIRFSIDDFGTGFSSLAYLTRLPVSSLKIDKVFVRAIENEDSTTAVDKKLITAMINLAHSIDLKVVAEGVENETQLNFLKANGCDLLQGYLLGRPVSADAITQLLMKHQELNE